MVVVLVDAMNARAPSAVAGVIFVVDTLAFIDQIVADGIRTVALAASPCSVARLGHGGWKSIKPACEGGFYKGFRAAAQ
jgi:hypothetical protein